MLMSQHNLEQSERCWNTALEFPGPDETGGAKLKARGMCIAQENPVPRDIHSVL